MITAQILKSSQQISQCPVRDWGKTSRLRAFASPVLQYCVLHGKDSGR